MGECTKGGFCNFMHLKPISRDLRRRLYGEFRQFLKCGFKILNFVQVVVVALAATTYVRTIIPIVRPRSNVIVNVIDAAVNVWAQAAAIAAPTPPIAIVVRRHVDVDCVSRLVGPHTFTMRVRSYDLLLCINLVTNVFFACV
jgi:hypothetical protein